MVVNTSWTISQCDVHAQVLGNAHGNKAIEVTATGLYAVRAVKLQRPQCLLSPPRDQHCPVLRPGFHGQCFFDEDYLSQTLAMSLRSHTGKVTYIT